MAGRIGARVRLSQLGETAAQLALQDEREAEIARAADRRLEHAARADRGQCRAFAQVRDGGREPAAPVMDESEQTARDDRLELCPLEPRRPLQNARAELFGPREVAARDAVADRAEDGVEQRGRRLARPRESFDARCDLVELGGTGTVDREHARDQLRLKIDLARIALRTGWQPAQQVERVAELGGSLLVAVARPCDLRGTGVMDRRARLTVGSSFSVIGGGSDNELFVASGSIGRSMKVGFAGDAECLMNFSTIGGPPVTAALGRGDGTVFRILTSAKGPVSVTSLADANEISLRGSSEGTSIRYTGGAGPDDVDLKMVAPRATATLDLGDGNDILALVGDGTLELKRLAVDFGEGTDQFLPDGYTLPAGSTLANLP